MEESLRVREGHLKGFIMYSLGEVMHAIVLFESFCVTDHLGEYRTRSNILNLACLM